jgi:hypothetical protein
MCSKEDYDKWVHGEFMFDTYNEVFVEMNIKITESDKAKAKKFYETSKTTYWKEWNQLSEEEVNEWYDKYMYEHNKIDRHRYNTYDDFFNDEYLETFVDEYTTKSGEVVIVFGKYGYDN